VPVRVRLRADPGLLTTSVKVLPSEQPLRKPFDERGVLLLITHITESPTMRSRTADGTRDSSPHGLRPVTTPRCRREETVYLLLAGGDNSTQTSDINRAQKMLREPK
jgi:hypothetical protein